MNLRKKKGRSYLVRFRFSISGEYKNDQVLNEKRIRYFEVVTDLILDGIKMHRQGKQVDKISLTF